jgi:formylmethanofuran dehydrogenase subunit C
MVGAAYIGSPHGMTGGSILVGGDAGCEIGRALRRGTIAIGGAAGELVGFNMIAGTVLVVGRCGIRPGAGMRRGTIALLGPAPPLLSSFRYACTARLVALSLVLGDLRAKGLSANAADLPVAVEVYNGDFVSAGRGEMLLRPQHTA